MAGDSQVAITPGSGATAAAYQDTANNLHQKMIMEMQGPTDPADPVKVNATNPLPITGGLDAAAFTRGASNEVPVAGAVEAANPTLTAGKAGALSLDTAGNLRTKDSTTAVDGSAFTTGTSREMPIGAVAVSSAPTNTAGTVNALTADVNGNLNVKVSAGAIPAGTVAAPSSALVSTTPVLSTAPGTSTSKVRSAASSTNATNIKASPGVIVHMRLFNTTSTTRYVHFYDTTSVPTAGSGTVKWTEVIPANSGNGGGSVGDIGGSGGIPFANGIAYTITTGVAESDTGQTALDDVTGVIVYK